MSEVLSLSLGNAAQSVRMELVGDWTQVYRPSIVGRTFADTLLRYPLKGSRVLDIGCGSGVISIAAALCGAKVTAVDINAAAVATTLENARRNGVEVEGLVGDALSSIASRKFDFVVANCPLAPSELSVPQNAPVENGVNGFRLWNKMVSGSGPLMSPAGSLIIWMDSCLATFDYLDAMRTHWNLIEEIRRFERATPGIDKGGWLKPGALIGGQPIEERMLAASEGRHWSRGSFYRLSEPVSSN